MTRARRTTGLAGVDDRVGVPDRGARFDDLFVRTLLDRDAGLRRLHRGVVAGLEASTTSGSTPVTVATLVTVVVPLASSHSCTQVWPGWIKPLPSSPLTYLTGAHLSS